MATVSARAMAFLPAVHDAAAAQGGAPIDARGLKELLMLHIASCTDKNCVTCARLNRTLQQPRGAYPRPSEITAQDSHRSPGPRKRISLDD